jgi:hypothetical protein
LLFGSVHSSTIAFHTFTKAAQPIRLPAPSIIQIDQNIENVFTWKKGKKLEEKEERKA